MTSQAEFKCPRCGLALPGGSTFCPECGKDFREQLIHSPLSAAPKKDFRRMNIFTATAGTAALAFGIITFQLGYSSLFLAFIVPALAFVLVYVWERNRGLKPGWEFIALSIVGTYAGATFGFIYVLIPVLIYFLVLRYQLNRKAQNRARQNYDSSSKS